MTFSYPKYRTQISIVVGGRVHAARARQQEGADCIEYKLNMQPKCVTAPFRRHGQLSFAAEGSVWCHGWKGPQVEALKTVSALSREEPASPEGTPDSISARRVFEFKTIGYDQRSPQRSRR